MYRIEQGDRPKPMQVQALEIFIRGLKGKK